MRAPLVQLPMYACAYRVVYGMYVSSRTVGHKYKMHCHGDGAFQLCARKATHQHHSSAKADKKFTPCHAHRTTNRANGLICKEDYLSSSYSSSKLATHIPDESTAMTSSQTTTTSSRSIPADGESAFLTERPCVIRGISAFWVEFILRRRRYTVQ